jgi:putative transcriptional regulator
MGNSKILVRGTIKNRINVILAERDMSIKDLANLVDYHYTTMQRFCSGKYQNINLPIIAKICEVMGIQPGDILVYVPPVDR